jgi:hypothetical protein
VSEAERYEFMNKVRWKTAGYICWAFSSLLVGGTGGFYMIKADIKGVGNDVAVLRSDFKSDNKELRHHVDSLHHDDLNQFTELWNAINNKNIPEPKRIIKVANDGCLMGKVIKGHLEWVPVDCDYNQNK